MDIPLFEVMFDKAARLVEAHQEADAIRYLTAPPGNQTTDVLVLAHGWNNDMDEARTLFRGFLGQLAALVPAGRSVAAIGILWPSKKFDDPAEIAGGAASAADSGELAPALAAQLSTLKAAFGSSEADEKLDRLAALVPNLENDPAAQAEFVSTLGGLLDTAADPRQTTPEEGTVRLRERDGPALLAEFAQPVLNLAPVDLGGGGAASLGDGGAASLGDVLNSISAGALRLLNLTTYYVMKDRAGLVGREGVNPLLSRIQAAVPGTIRFHLAGHSFGGRLVTATVDGSNRLRVDTLLLLQAAFSHNGFAARFDGVHDGFFRNVVAGKKVSGRILITHSVNDQAVGVAYPLASRLNGDAASAFGGPDDRFGGMGRNGAQHVTDLSRDMDLLASGSPYSFDGGALIFNLNGDAIIRNHGDVARPETAWALVQGGLSS